MSKLIHLTQLKMTSCQLKIFPMAVLSIPNLEILDLSFNRIKSIPSEINQLVKLKKLNMSQNQLNYLRQRSVI